MSIAGFFLTALPGKAALPFSAWPVQADGDERTGNITGERNPNDYPWEIFQPDRDPLSSEEVVNIQNADSPLGMNISHLSYYSTEWPLLDAMKTSGGWYTQAVGVWDTGERHLLPSDENGWVTALPKESDAQPRYRWIAALMLNGTGGRYPAGAYTVFYKGRGKLEYGNDAVKDEALSRPGRDVVRVENPGDGGILLRITEIDPDDTGDYLRDIRVIMPGGLCGGNSFAYCPADGSCPPQKDCVAFTEIWRHQVFHPLFLENLRSYRVIRMMDLLRTNTSMLSSWQQRPRWTDVRWTSENGVPLELALALAVRLNADPWLNIPAQADDDYVTRFALLAKRHLRPEQRVYLEYANEVWNGAFSAGDWVQQQARVAWPTSDATAYTKRINGYGVRSAEIARIWKSVWGEEADRIVAVMGAQAANPWVAQEALDCPLNGDGDESECASAMDAIAIAPYFGGHLGGGPFPQALAGWRDSEPDGLDLLFEELTTGVAIADISGGGSLERVTEWIAQHAAIAQKYGLQLLAYEGGQHLVGLGPELKNADLTDLFIRANRDPRMYDLYRELLAAWREHGGGLFCHFLSVGAYTQYGSWGAKEHQTQQDAPKHRALMDFIAENPIWWGDQER